MASMVLRVLVVCAWDRMGRGVETYEEEPFW